MLDSLLQAHCIVETEINAVTDNPVVDVQHGQFWHGGHFHGEYIAMVSDQLRANVAKLMMLTERRINFFLDTKRNRRLPPFLNMKKLMRRSVRDRKSTRLNSSHSQISYAVVRFQKK